MTHLHSRKYASNRYGFTLVELVVAAACIVLLAMLMVSCTFNNAAMERARQSKCKSNLRNISQACTIYMNSTRMHGNSEIGSGLPRATPPPSASNWASASKGNASALWLLTKYKLIGRDSLLCPSAGASGDFQAPGPDDTGFTDNTLSYSYLSQVAFTDANTNEKIELTSNLNRELDASKLAIIADANPRRKPGQQGLDNDQIGANSRNHNQTGQNVGFMSGRARWFSTTRIPETNPLNSSSEPDDIYQSCGSKDDDANGRRGAINDAFLIP